MSDVIVEVFEFEILGKEYDYTDAKDFTFQGMDYKGIYIIREATDDSGGETEEPLMDIVMSGNVEVVTDHFLFQTLPSLKIYQINFTNNTKTLIFCGDITGISRISESTGETCRMQARSIYETELSTEIPTRVYQSICNNKLGDKYCKVNLNNYMAGPVPIRGINRNIITLQPNLNVSAKRNVEDNYFQGGSMKLVKNEQYRDIISSRRSGRFTINFPFHDAVVGDTVEVVAGCDRTLRGQHGCVLKFNNKNNFGGFDIPNEDTQQIGLR